MVVAVWQTPYSLGRAACLLAETNTKTPARRQRVGTLTRCAALQSPAHLAWHLSESELLSQPPFASRSRRAAGPRRPHVSAVAGAPESRWPPERLALQLPGARGQVVIAPYASSTARGPRLPCGLPGCESAGLGGTWRLGRQPESASLRRFEAEQPRPAGQPRAPCATPTSAAGPHLPLLPAGRLPAMLPWPVQLGRASGHRAQFGACPFPSSPAALLRRKRTVLAPGGE